MYDLSIAVTRVTEKDQVHYDDYKKIYSVTEYELLNYCWFRKGIGDQSSTCRLTADKLHSVYRT